jgi:hypothetical protein
MNRVVILVLAALLLCAAPAQGQRVGGHNEPTKDLESSFKILASERIGADDECYPSPGKMAAELRRYLEDEVIVVPDLASVHGGKDVINVVSGESECNRVVMAMRYRGQVFILNSEEGPVYIQGREGANETVLPGAEGPLRDLAVSTGGFRVHTAHELVRLAVHCPDDTFPLGGGMFTHRPIDEDGEGVYAHSYERLGAQRGFHVTPTFVTPERHDLTPRRGDLQVICGRGLVPTTTEHQVTFVRREGTGSVTSRCPEGTELFSGGFQRTNFTTPEVTYGGNYITESRAVDGNAWRVSAGATDDDGGELVAIAHCAEEDPSLPLRKVSASVEVPKGESATATTPSCPPGRALTAGGFSFNGSHDALFAEAYFTREGTWSATGYGWWDSAELTAYGYCLEVADDADRSAFPREAVAEKRLTVREGDEARSGDDDSDESGVGDLGVPIYVGLGVAALALPAWLWRRRRRA